MNLSRMLAARAAEGRPVRVALIGAGKFGSMYLTQARLTTGVQVAAIVDLDPARAGGHWPHAAGRTGNRRQAASTRPWNRARPM